MRTTARRLVVAGVLTVQLATVVLLILASGRFSADAESDHTGALLETAASEAADHTTAYLAPASALVATTADMVDGGVVDTAALERAFIGELERSPQLANVYLGSDDGSFFFVTRTDDGFSVKTIEILDGVRRVRTVELGADGARADAVEVLDDSFDPRERPWFQDASRTGSTDVAWTPPYVFFTSGHLGVTASAAVVSADGKLVVVGADIELAALSGFLDELRIGPTGSAVIVDQTGTVIAHPVAAVVRGSETEPTETISASELADPRARAVIGSIISAGADGERTTTRFESSAGSGVAAYRTVTFGSQEWTVAVHADDGALVAGLIDARSNERLLMIVVGLLGFILLAVAVFPVTRPLARLERRARVDALTGLLNRGAILARGAQMVKEPALHAAIMIDLDHFKAINDTHGHQVGDEVLHAIGLRISGALRGGDSAGRVGGEEFLVLLGRTTPARAAEVAERLHGAIGATPVETTVGSLPVTASVGIGLAVGSGELQRTLAVADTALLEAKESGRNCVVSGGMASELRPPRRASDVQ